MKTVVICIFSVFFRISLYATSFTFGESIDVASHEQLIQLILENRNYCAEEVTDSEIRLKSNQLYPTEEGLFLRINQFDLVRLPYVLSSADGCSIATSS
jgi:hypothetical protein